MKGMVVEELGWDEDVDDDLRQTIMELVDSDLVEESEESVDAVLIWMRQSDGDVMDLLIDSLTDLGPAGLLWVLTPKIGRNGHVSQSDLAEGVVAAGLCLTTSASVSKDWSAHKVVRPKATRK
jgi:Na+(H+)/acetate symporter ActP